MGYHNASRDIKKQRGFRVHVAGPKAYAIIKQAKQRNMAPRTLVREMLLAIAQDDLFEAVIGDKYPQKEREA